MTLEDKLGEKAYSIIWHDPKRKGESGIARVTYAADNNLDSILGWLYRENYIIEHINNLDDDLKDTIIKRRKK